MPLRVSASPVEFQRSWVKPIEFVLSLLGFTVGFGNVWRFPYKAYENGGGAFVVAYTILLVLVGIPLYFLEAGIGQFTSRGTVATCTIIPAWQGVGVGMIVNCIILSIYYIILMVYSCKFLYFSFYPVLPWTECESWWDADAKCVDQENYTYPLTVRREKFNASQSSYKQPSSQQFWQKYILHNKSGANLTNLGYFCPDLALVLVLNWIITYLCIVGGIKTSGKVVYFTSLFPYCVLLIVAMIAMFLEGASDGLLFLFVPNMEKFLEVNIWMQAATQLLFSLGLGVGSIIMYSSLNHFDYQFKNDVYIITLVDFFTSILASALVFSSLGYIGNKLKTPVEEVMTPDPGLTFIVVSGILRLYPLPQLWSVLYFFTLFIIGLNTQFVFVETILLTITDCVKLARKHNYTACFVLCILGCLAGLPLCTEGGFYILHFLTSYGHDVAFLYTNFALLITVMYFYGFQKYSDDVEFMLQYPYIPRFYYWKICWVIVAPLILLILLVYATHYMKNTDMDGKELPVYMVAVKWVLAMAAPAMTPIFFVVALIKLRKRESGIMYAVINPNPSWGPRDLITKTTYLTWKRQRALFNKTRNRRGIVRLMEYIFHINSPASILTPVPSYDNRSEESKATVQYGEIGDQ